jgi:hypothetical protein
MNILLATYTEIYSVNIGTDDLYIYSVIVLYIVAARFTTEWI